MSRRHVSRQLGSARRWRWVAAGWTLLLLFVLWVPGDSIPAVEDRWTLPEGFDKGIHGFLFCFEALWLLMAFRGTRRALASAVGLTLVLAAVTEIGQLWIPGRDGDLGDLAADLFGAGIGLVLGRRLEQLQPTRHQKPSEI